MNRIIYLFCICLFAIGYTNAQDTFSIVAIDSITGEIGSAGASCLDNIQFPGSNGAIIISDIIPGRGAIHTQAAYFAANQIRANSKMQEGLSAQEIIDYMADNDAIQFNAFNRQYGIVDVSPTGSPRAAAFTGMNCMDYKNHIVGPNYAIQGNILLGQSILDSMEANFLNTSGTLADKLMAALQGANVPGADTRCLSNGTSSLSAFLRVAKPMDPVDNIYLDLNVPSLPAGQEPIDSVQSLYNQWQVTNSSVVEEKTTIRFYPNPIQNGLLYVQNETKGTTLFIFNLQGQSVLSQSLQRGSNTIEFSQPEGLYFARVYDRNKQVQVTEKLLVQE